MLNFRHRARSGRRWPAAGASASDRSDLQIRSLLDDPQLRRAMGLDVPVASRPRPRFDRRRLLDDAAA